MSTQSAVLTQPRDPVFEELSKVYASGRLVLFVGAGISAAAGLPTWRQLVDRVAEIARHRGAEAPRLQEIEVLLNQGKLIDALSAAKDAIGSGAEFCNVVEQALDDTPLEIPEVGHAIAALAPRLRAVLTTNLDHLLERSFEGRWQPMVRPPANIAQQERYVLKLHGTLRDRSSWVMTREDYDSAMYSNPQLQETFSAIFRAYPLLFLGFGLADDNFDAVFARVRALAGQQPPQHFALVARETLTPNRRKLLESSGIRFIPYDNPDGKHSEVVRILHALANGANVAGNGSIGGNNGRGVASSGGLVGIDQKNGTSSGLSKSRRLSRLKQVVIALTGVTGILIVGAWLDRSDVSPSTPHEKVGSAAAEESTREKQLAGLVKGENSLPLSEVRVSLPALGMEVVTDRFGRYRFSIREPVPESVRLVAQKAGYESYDIYVFVENPGYNFTMSRLQR